MAAQLTPAELTAFSDAVRAEFAKVSLVPIVTAEPTIDLGAKISVSARFARMCQLEGEFSAHGFFSSKTVSIILHWNRDYSDFDRYTDAGLTLDAIPETARSSVEQALRTSNVQNYQVMKKDYSRPTSIDILVKDTDLAEITSIVQNMVDNPLTPEQTTRCNEKEVRLQSEADAAAEAEKQEILAISLKLLYPKI